MARIAFVVGEDFEDSEFKVPYDELRGAGHDVEVLGAKAGETMKGKKGKEEIAIQAARGAQRIADADVENFNDPSTDPAQYVQKPTKSMGKTSDSIAPAAKRTTSEPTRSASKPSRRA